MKNAASLADAARTLIWFGAVWTAFSLLIGGGLGYTAWMSAKIGAQGRTASARILRIDAPGSEGSLDIHYDFTLPSGQSVEDTVSSSPSEVAEKLNTGRGPVIWGSNFPPIPTTVQYLPGQPAYHRLHGFGYASASGSPLFGGLLLSVFVAVGGGILSQGVKMKRTAEAPVAAATEAVELKGNEAAGNADVSGSIPGFTYRREGERFIFQPTKSSLLALVLKLVIMVAGFGVFAGMGVWVLDVGDKAAGVGLLLFAGIPIAAALGAIGQALCYGLRPSILDRGQGQFQVGGRVICDLSAIARLHLRRGFNPDDPADARYFTSFVLHDGRRVPLGLSSFIEFPNHRETLIGRVSKGEKIEAVMKGAAAFIGVEYTFTQERDPSLQAGDG